MKKKIWVRNMWKIWVQNVGIKKIVKKVTKEMSVKNVGVEKCE